MFALCPTKPAVCTTAAFHLLGRSFFSRKRYVHCLSRVLFWLNAGRGRRAKTISSSTFIYFYPTEYITVDVSRLVYVHRSCTCTEELRHNLVMHCARATPLGTCKALHVHSTPPLTYIQSSTILQHRPAIKKRTHMALPSDFCSLRYNPVGSKGAYNTPFSFLRRYEPYLLQARFLSTYHLPPRKYKSRLTATIIGCLRKSFP